jgi:hypothetical protein
LKDEAYQARVAALSIAQCTTVVTFLRARGQDAHAENVEAAINAVTAIISDELGRDTFAQAMKWVSDQARDGAELAESVTVLH